MSTEYGEGSGARARRRRSAITFSVVLLMLFFAFWYALSYIRADEASSATTTSTTSWQSSTCDISPSQVEVNVYNATDRDGLAARVAEQLKKRGFDVKTVANDPKRADLEGAGELRYGSNGRKGAGLVAQHTGEFQKKQDVRKRTSVDVVLGPTFTQLVPEDAIEAC